MTGGILVIWFTGYSSCSHCSFALRWVKKITHKTKTKRPNLFLSLSRLLSVSLHSVCSDFLSLRVRVSGLVSAMASSSSEPGLKPESGGGSGSGGGETSEAAVASDQLLLYRGLKKAKKERGSTAKERISKMPPCAAGKRSSIYRGVTR